MRILSRRTFLAGAAVAAVAGAGALVVDRRGSRPAAPPTDAGTPRAQPRPSTTTSARAAERPNIVVVVADDLRFDALGATGNNIVQTPNIDALAREGVQFPNHFVTTSICPTSRASILTGRYARSHGVWDFGTPLVEHLLDSSYPVLLRAAGYHVGFVGKWGIGGDQPRERFDSFEGFSDQEPYYDQTGQRASHLDAHIGELAQDFVRSAAAQAPFCLSVSFKAPHHDAGDVAAYTPDRRLFGLYTDVAIPLPKTATDEHFRRLPPFLQDSEGRDRWTVSLADRAAHQETVADYYRLITGMDQAIGGLRSALEDLDVWRNTAFFFTSDNGLMLGEHGLTGKWWGFEESMHTPLIARLPTRPAAATVEAISLNVDIAPTILDLAGLRAPDDMHGSSLVPAWNGDRLGARSGFYYEHFVDHPRITPTEGVRTHSMKYLLYPNEVADNEMLFDLGVDPYEEQNLARDPAHAEELDRLRQLMTEYRDALT